jgi:molybdopterin-guanine dinucleotide biosynthesis protein A
MSLPRIEPTSAVVLAGGQSRRLGQDKRRLRLWGEGGPTLLERTIATVGALCAEVVAVLNDPEDWPGLNARLVGDVYPEGGALGGIYSGLLACAHGYALVVACDMPLLSPALLGAMLARPREYDVLVPRSPTPGAARNNLDIEPLHAVYSKACLSPMREALAANRRQIAAFFPAVRVAYVERAEIALHDPHSHSFLNVNTGEQMAEVERLLG